MNKFFSITACFLLLFALTACKTTKADIAMITDIGGIDDKSFNQATWEGIRLYATMKGKTCQYIQPAGQSDDDYLRAISEAVRGEAEIILTPGHLFAYAISEAQEKYPDVYFVILDSDPAGGAAENTVGISFAEEQAGYMAGYAAVMDGYRKLGFLGGIPVPGVVRYGFGYVQGANDAAKKLSADVEMLYTYIHTFEESQEAQDLAESWYAQGTEVIFACGGAMNKSIFAAAEKAEAKTIGVDMDQSKESETVITSATKNLGAAAGRTLEQFYAGDFPGGQSIIMGVQNSAVGLCIETSRFQTFSKQDYDALAFQISNGEIFIQRDDERGETAASPFEMGLPLEALHLEYIDSLTI